MRAISSFSIVVFSTLVLACNSSTSPRPGEVWGSEQASLTIQDGSTTLRIFNGENCYGQFGVIPEPLASSTFDVDGTFVQVTGFAPGHVDYAAHFTGGIVGALLTITIEVPALHQHLGPYVLTRNVKTDRDQCLYP